MLFTHVQTTVSEAIVGCFWNLTSSTVLIVPSPACAHASLCTSVESGRNHVVFFYNGGQESNSSWTGDATSTRLLNRARHL